MRGKVNLLVFEQRSDGGIVGQLPFARTLSLGIDPGDSGGFAQRTGQRWPTLRLYTAERPQEKILVLARPFPQQRESGGTG